MKYVYTGPTFGVIVYNSKASNALNYNQDRRPLHCILGKFLFFTTIVARCLCVCKVAREPSGKKWNYFRRFVIFFAEMTASSPFMSMFLATNLQVIDDDIEGML